MRGSTIRAAIIVLGVLLVVGYIGVDMVLPLPVFLVAENLFWAVVYAAPLAMLATRGEKMGPLLWLVVVSAANLGRVSRSIITPYGTPGPLALEHIPLATVIALVLALSSLALYREASRVGGGRSVVAK